MRYGLNFHKDLQQLFFIFVKKTNFDELITLITLMALIIIQRKNYINGAIVIKIVFRLDT